MNLSFSDDERLLAEAVARWAEARSDDSRRRAEARPQGFDPKGWAEIAALGWLGAAVPEDHGGAGLGPSGTAIVMEGAGRAQAPEPLTPALAMLPPILIAAGRADLLDALMAGEALGALALDEPDRPFAPDRPATAFRDGRLHGAVARVPGAQAADWVVVPAMGPQGLTLTLVRPDAAGVTLAPRRLLDNRMGADLSFDGAPAEALTLPDPAAVLAEAQDQAVPALCAEAVGVASALFAATLAHLKSREQFGQPLARFQALQHRMADLHVALEEARSTVLMAVAALSDPDPAARGRALATAFCETTDRCLKVGAEAIQLHGGLGMTEALPIGAGFRRLKAISVSLGGRDRWLDRFLSLDAA